MSKFSDMPSAMSSYEREAWKRLDRHWEKKAKHRELIPPKARAALDSAGDKAREVASKAGHQVGKYAPEPVKRAGEFVVDEALAPTIKAAAELLELAEDWAAELMDPEEVLKYHRARGHAVSELEDLRALDLEPLDVFTRRMALKGRSIGGLEGAATGVLAFVPVVGTFAGLSADVLLMQMLSTAVASRAMYSYGFNAHHPEEHLMVQKIVRRSYRAQAPKVKAVSDASKAYKASKARVNWSKKIRDDHRLMAAVEKLMKQFTDGSVSIQDVSKKMPAIGIATSAGSNAYILGDVAKHGIMYAQTRLLAEKYDLVLPPNLIHFVDDDDDDLSSP